MAKKCNVCGKDASFLAGGGDFKGKTLCFECYDKAAKAKNEEELNLIGFDSGKSEKEAEGQVFILIMRVLAWIQLFFSFIISIRIWDDSGVFSMGMMNLVTGAIIFTVLHVLSYIAENISAIRINLETRNKEDNTEKK